MIDPAIDRGEIPASIGIRLLLEALIGPLHFRALLTDELTGPGISMRSSTCSWTKAGAHRSSRGLRLAR
jgi:hypothetical protein